MKPQFHWLAAIILPFLVVACDDPATIQVENAVRGGVIKNVRWGDVFLSDALLPGERSPKKRVYDNSTSGVDLPEENPVVFYLEVNGDVVFLETREQFRLDINQHVDIIINDSTPVYNSLTDD